jgi:Peptidase family C78/Ubiquitin-Binding Zinc Finger
MAAPSPEVVDLTSLDVANTTTCPICNQDIPVSEVQAHCDAHFATDVAPSADVGCSICGLPVALEDLESHELAHTYEQTAEGEAGDDGTGNDNELERLYFEELRARYGFQNPSRPGRCFICGEASHWVRECPRNPDNMAAQQRIVASVHPASIIACSQRDGHDGGLAAVPSLIELLAECLRAQPRPPGGKQYAAFLSGPVAHYGSVRYDAGWGCGYRNAQVQAGHILMTRAVGWLWYCVLSIIVF